MIIFARSSSDVRAAIAQSTSPALSAASATGTQQWRRSEAEYSDHQPYSGDVISPSVHDIGLQHNCYVLIVAQLRHIITLVGLIHREYNAVVLLLFKPIYY